GVAIRPRQPQGPVPLRVAGDGGEMAAEIPGVVHETAGTGRKGPRAGWDPSASVGRQRGHAGRARGSSGGSDDTPRPGAAAGEETRTACIGVSVARSLAVADA